MTYILSAGAMLIFSVSFLLKMLDFDVGQKHGGKFTDQIDQMPEGR